MPTKVEKDSITGRETTGHEWDGLKELNTPLPKWWLYVFYACIAFSVVWVVIYPAIPMSGLRGLSGRYANARQGAFDGNGRDVTEMDALVAYLQMLGTLVQFRDVTPEQVRQQ